MVGQVATAVRKQSLIHFGCGIRLGKAVARQIADMAVETESERASEDRRKMAGKTSSLD